MFSNKVSMAYSFLRNIRIRSNAKKMFDSFLTFSTADGHWKELHKKLSSSEKYLAKRIVKNWEDVDKPEIENCITEHSEIWIPTLRHNTLSHGNVYGEWPTIKERELAQYDLPEYPKEPIWSKFDDNLYDENTEEEKEIVKSIRVEQYERDVKNVMK